MTSRLMLLQDWFKAQCDGNWEHRTAVSIVTTDNPGWYVEIDLNETSAENKEFPKYERNMEPETDWIFCEKKQGKFIGAGGIDNLDEILSVFLDWINSANIQMVK